MAVKTEFVAFWVVVTQCNNPENHEL